LNDTRSIGAKRHANENFSPPRRRARRQKIRDVRASDREQRDHRRKRRDERHTRVAHQLVAEREQPHRPAAIRARVCGSQSIGERGHDTLCSLDRNAVA
jgi:hypothetical protein